MASIPRGVRRGALVRADLDHEPDSSWIGRAPGRHAGWRDSNEGHARRASARRGEPSPTGLAAAAVRGYRTRCHRGPPRNSGKGSDKVARDRVFEVSSGGVAGSRPFHCSRPLAHCSSVSPRSPIDAFSIVTARPAVTSVNPSKGNPPKAAWDSPGGRARQSRPANGSHLRKQLRYPRALRDLFCWHIYIVYTSYILVWSAWSDLKASDWAPPTRPCRGTSRGEPREPQADALRDPAPLP